MNSYDVCCIVSCFGSIHVVSGDGVHLEKAKGADDEDEEVPYQACPGNNVYDHRGIMTHILNEQSSSTLVGEQVCQHLG